MGELLDALPPGNQSMVGGNGGSRHRRDANAAHAGVGGGPTGAAALDAARLSTDGRELQPSRFASMLQPPRMLRCGEGALRGLATWSGLPLLLYTAFLTTSQGGCLTLPACPARPAGLSTHGPPHLPASPQLSWRQRGNGGFSPPVGA